MMTLPETWSKKDKVNWVATRMATLDRGVRAWEKKKGLNVFESFTDTEPPKKLEDMYKEITNYPAEIRSAATELNKYFDEVEIEAKSHSLEALRILLEGEHIFYELSGEELTWAHVALWEEARRAE